MGFDGKHKDCLVPTPGNVKKDGRWIRLNAVRLSGRQLLSASRCELLYFVLPQGTWRAQDNRVEPFTIALRLHRFSCWIYNKNMGKVAEPSRGRARGIRASQLNGNQRFVDCGYDLSTSVCTLELSFRLRAIRQLVLMTHFT